MIVHFTIAWGAVRKCWSMSSGTATNRDLETAVRAGTFRRDLFHRISEVHIEVPPLRDRPQDILALAEHFLTCNRPGARLTPVALDILLRMEWRGNVRELRNLILKVDIFVPHSDISAEDILRHTCDGELYVSPPPPGSPDSITRLDELERTMIRRALESTGGNQSLAASRLGMPRCTFCRKLNVYDILFRRRKSASLLRGATSFPAHFRAELKVPLSVKSRDGRCFMAEARNLSSGGVGVQNFCSPFDPSEELVLEFKLPNVDRPVVLKGVVVWSRPNATAGIKFTEIDVATSELLRVWIANSGRPVGPVDPAKRQDLDEGKNGRPGHGSRLSSSGLSPFARS